MFPENIDQFEKVRPFEYDTFRVPYDYGSILHYPEKAGSKNGLATIITKDPAWQNLIGKFLLPSKKVSTKGYTRLHVM